MAYRRYYDDDDPLGAAFLSWAFVILVIAYVVSLLGTYLVLDFLINPHLLKHKMDEDDRLVLLWSTILWTAGAILISFPAVADPLQNGEVASALSVLGSSAVAGCVWGLLVGGGVVWWMWKDIEPPQLHDVVPGFATVVDGIPVEHYQPGQDSTEEQRELTRAELEAAMLAGRSREAVPNENPVPAPVKATPNGPVEVSVELPYP